MIANLQPHYGFTRMPFTKDIRPRPVLLRRLQGSRRPAPLAHLRPRAGRDHGRSKSGQDRLAPGRRRRPGRLPPRPVYLPNPHVGVRGIHGALATALGKAPCFYTSDLIPQVEAALPPKPTSEPQRRPRHRRIALLTGDELEAVRMLTSHDLDSGSPLTVLLIGQPTLRRTPARRRHGSPRPASELNTLSPSPPSPRPRPTATSAPTSPTRPHRHPLLRRRRPRHPLPRPRPAPRHQPPRGHRAARRLHRDKTIADEKSARTAIAEKPPTRQTDHHDDTTSTTAPPGTRGTGPFSPSHRHRERRHGES